MQLHVHNYVCITYIAGLYIASSNQSNREGISSSQAATGMLHGWAGLESTGIITYNTYRLDETSKQNSNCESN